MQSEKERSILNVIKIQTMRSRSDVESGIEGSLEGKNRTLNEIGGLTVICSKMRQCRTFKTLLHFTFVMACHF